MNLDNILIIFEDVFKIFGETINKQKTVSNKSPNKDVHSHKTNRRSQ